MNATRPFRWERFEIHGDEAYLRWDAPADRLWRTTAVQRVLDAERASSAARALVGVEIPSPA